MPEAIFIIHRLINDIFYYQDGVSQNVSACCQNVTIKACMVGQWTVRELEIIVLLSKNNKSDRLAAFGCRVRVKSVGTKIQLWGHCCTIIVP